MVALTFDNTDKYLHSDFNEVEIKRIVYSSGEMSIISIIRE